MRMSRRVPHSTVVWLQGIALSGALLNTVCLPSFGAESDLYLTAAAAPVPVVVGQELQFFLGLVNQGPDSAEDVVVEIDLPAEVSLIAVLPSQGVCLPGPPLICQLGPVSASSPTNRAGITVETVANVASGISLIALVRSATPDPLPDNNSADTWLNVVELAHSADLLVDPQIPPSPVLSGATMEFMVEVANDGPASAGIVDVRVGIQELRMVNYVSASSSQGQCSTALDTCAGFQCLAVLNELLDVSCDLGGLSAGGKASIRVTSAIDVEAGEHLTLSARVGARDMADSDPSNNSIAVAVPVVEMPAIDIPGGAGPGGCFIETVFSGTPWDE